MPTRLSYNGDPNWTLEEVYRAELDEYNNKYRPINREMIASVDSTEMVDSAKTSANEGFDNAKERQDRMAERYGMTYSAIQQAESQNRNAAARALNYDNTVNNARLAQYERNNQVRNEMIAVGRGIDNSAYQQLTNAANLQTQRENQNNQMSAQADAANTQMMGSLASAGLTALAFAFM